MSYDLGNCKTLNVDFIYQDNDPEVQSVQDEIKSDLAKIGITVNGTALDGETFWSSDTLLNGTYNIRFGRTWGAPYDPHSFLTSWAEPTSPTYNDHENLVAPLTREMWIGKIEQVQSLQDEREIQALWTEILNDIHQQATVVSLWGNRIPYVLNRRLEGFVPGSQILAFPLDTIQVVEGSKNVSINGGDDGSFFSTVGSMNPHLYSTNLFYVTAWIYEGLVGYGEEGEIVPALAVSWTREATDDDGQRYTFVLREGVTFHDGSDFNCTVAKLNFDHVLSDTMRKAHSWYGTARFLKSWTCTDDGKFVLETDRPFYPLLQELTYIRPLVFASATSFAQGLDSDPDLHNSCEAGMLGRNEHLEQNVTCLGLSAPIGTGPFKFVEREAHPDDDAIDAAVTFARNDDYWGVVPDIEHIELRYYPDNDAVYDALLSGDLDMAMGIGPLTAVQVQDLKYEHSSRFDVRHSAVTQNSLLFLNTARPPTDDINVRRSIIHALDKSIFVEKEFAGLEQPASQLMPFSLPYTDIDLTPKLSYDFDKAASINCPTTAMTSSSGSSSGNDDGLSGGAIAGIAVGAVLVSALLGLVGVMIRREKRGTPLFSAEQVKSAENV